MNKTWLAYCRLMRINKPIGTLLLLWPTWWALWLTGSANLSLFITFTLGVFLMRSAGCVINDYADRNVDGYVERTKSRPLPNNEVTPKQAMILFFALLLSAFLLVLTLNRLTIILSFFAAATAIIYPFMKRYTHLPQLVLALAFSWGIPLAYAATIESFPVTCWLLCLVNIFWTIAYDTQYAMVDREDDIKIGVKSTAILFGHYDRLIVGCLQVLTLVFLILIAMINSLLIYSYVSIVIVAILFIYQQTLMQSQQPKPCFKAFMNNNYVGLLIFLGLIVS